MTDDKAKVSPKANNGEHSAPDLLVWHVPHDWKDSKGKKHHTKGHWEISPQLSPARKAEARKAKEALLAKEQPAKAKAPKPRAKKEAKPAEAASPQLLKLAAKNAKEAARDEAAAPAAGAKADA